jgi:hypothetical protein
LTDLSQPKKWWTRRRKWSVLLIALALTEVWYPWLWISLPVVGRVTDSRTHQPIAGAVIAGTWSVLGFRSDLPIALLKVKETVSDPTGAFVLPGWITLHVGPGYVPGSAPDLWVFRRGYLPARAGNRDVLMQGALPVIRTPTQNVELRPVSAVSLEDYRSEISSVAQLYLTNFMSDHCALLNFSRLLTELRAIRADFAARGMERAEFIDETIQGAHCH